MFQDRKRYVRPARSSVMAITRDPTGWSTVGLPVAPPASSGYATESEIQADGDFFASKCRLCSLANALA
jgi:hypothetical protein